jgi:hypothetical protein
MAKLGRSTRRGITAFDYIGTLNDEFDWVGGVKARRTTGGRGVWLNLTTNANIGDILLIDTANDNSVIQSNAANSALVIGVLVASQNLAAEPDFFNNVALNTKVFPQAFGATALVFVQIDGVAIITVSGTVARGDLITTSATAGQGQSNNGAANGTILGRALQAGTAGSQINVLISPG